MISGHTYFAFLFSIGAYSAIRLNAVMFPGVRNILLRRAVFWMCSACLVTELFLVGLSRFHYTVDMLAAIVLVLCLYDSRTVDQIAADWSEGFRWRDPEHFVTRCSLGSLLLWCKGRGKVDKIRAEQAIVPSKATQVMSMRDTTGYPPWSYPPDQYAHARNDRLLPNGNSTGTVTSTGRQQLGGDSGEIVPLIQ